MQDVVARLKHLVQAAVPDVAEIAAFLDGLSLDDAVRATRGLHGRKLQQALWNAVAANPRVTVEAFVPADYQPMKPVIFYGKNSLPAFTEFHKICCRPAEGADRSVLWGYNETSIKPVIGPGYYVVHATAADPHGGAAFDYTQLPTSHPRGWPPIRPNGAGISRLVYYGMIDYMRRVSRRVFIGSATKHGKEIGSYFVLTSELSL